MIYPLAPLATPDASFDPSRLPIAIGDLQGCCNALSQLLDKLRPAPHTPLWFAGDLVNRGPCSGEALRTVMNLGEQAVAVLGNHDLHLLAVAAGVRALKKGDTLTDILNAPDAAELIDWVRRRPLAYFEHGWLMVHAGVLPQWDVAQTLACAREVEAMLRGPDWQTGIAYLYGADPDHWDDALTGTARLRVITNALTRLRFCDVNGRMEFRANGAPGDAPAGFMPWFELPERRTASTRIVFGHWAALGLMLRDDVCGIDSGCVWGNRLSALRLAAAPQERVLTQVECERTKRGG